jgi:hypothetical protein
MPGDEMVVDNGADTQVEGENTVVNVDGLTPSGESETQSVEVTGEQTPEVEKKIPNHDEIIRKIREDERGKTKAAREDARQAREAADKALRIVEQLTTKPQQQEEYDPDMPMTRGEWERLDRQKKERDKQERQGLLVKETAAKAKADYKDAPLSWDEAIQYARDNFSEEQLLAALSDKKNPAQTLYNLVAIQPEFKARLTEGVQKETVKNTVATLNKHLNQAGTLSKSGSSNSTIDEVKRWDDMSYADILKEQEKIIASRS